MSRINYKSYRSITLFARELRKNQTPQEVVVWEMLRKRKFSGYKFLRQHPIFYKEDKDWIEFYIADFYCNKLKLVIEVDGKIHAKKIDYDIERDARLAAKGLKVVRIKNEFVYDSDALSSFIEKIINERIRDLKR